MRETGQKTAILDVRQVLNFVHFSIDLAVGKEDNPLELHGSKSIERMLRFIRPLCAVMSLLSVLAKADAASLTGDGLDFTSFHRGLAPYLGSAFSDASNHLLANGSDDSSAQAFDPLNPAAGRFGHFMRSGVEGSDASDALSGNVTTIAVEASSNAVKLTNSDLLFNPSSSVLTMTDPTGDLTRVAVSDVRADASRARLEQERLVGGVVESSIPLPPAFPLLAAAIVALAAFGYGLNRWVAPKGAKDAS